MEDLLSRIYENLIDRIVGPHPGWCPRLAVMQETRFSPMRNAGSNLYLQSQKI